MDDIDPAKLDAALERLQAEQSRRLQAKTEAGELVTVPLCVAVSTASKAPAAVEQAQTRKLVELRAAGEEREVRFDTWVVVSGVPARGEDIGEEWKPAPRPDIAEPLLHEDEDSLRREEPRPPIVESYVWVQTRPCRDDGNDPGQIMEGWFSIDDGTVTVTDREGRHITSRAMIAGEAPAALARLLLREKQPESEGFDRALDYPKLGIA
jgi:hypothetical protein